MYFWSEAQLLKFQNQIKISAAIKEKYSDWLMGKPVPSLCSCLGQYVNECMHTEGADFILISMLCFVMLWFYVIE